MLRNIPDIISPQLMQVMMEMGHGDEICLGDANFPDVSMGKRVVWMEGHTVPQVLEAMLQFFPLDTFVKKPCTLMASPDGEPKAWAKFREVIEANDFAGAFKDGFELVDRFDFYDRARNCFAVVSTSEHEAYSCLILKKGVIFK